MTYEEKINIIYKRIWNYSFQEGDCVMLDENIVSRELSTFGMPLWAFIGMKGTVINCKPETSGHSGSSYAVTADFEGTTVGPIKTYNLIPYKEADI